MPPTFSTSAGLADLELRGGLAEIGVGPPIPSAAEIQRLIAEAVALAVPLAVAAALAQPRPADSQAAWLTIRDMVSHMPRGSQSDASVRAWIKSGDLHGEKRRGRWRIDPQKAFADLKKVGDAGARVREFQATWQLKKAELKKARFKGTGKFGAKRRAQS